MSYLLYPFAALASVAIDLACRLCLNWLVVLAADGQGHLPRCLRWFQTFDASLDEGMLARRRELEAGIRGETTWSRFHAYPQNRWQVYLNRVRWLQRNTGYGFDYVLLGLSWHPAQWRVLRYVDTPRLTFFLAVAQDGRGFNLYAHGRWGIAKLGWKAWNRFNPYNGQFDRRWADDLRVPIVVSVNPFKRK